MSHKLCPCCGCKAYISRLSDTKTLIVENRNDDREGTTLYSIICRCCGLSTESFLTQEEAEEAWNNRVYTQESLEGIRCCPFCGGFAQLREDIGTVGVFTYKADSIVCSSCGAHLHIDAGFRRQSESLKQAEQRRIRNWNRRTNEWNKEG